MQELTPEKLRDFALCRRLYERKHVDGLLEKKPKSKRDLLVDEFENSIVKSIKWYYFETMAGKDPSFKSLQWKWDKLWFKGVTAADIMSEVTDPGKNRNTYNTEAQKILSRFYETHKMDTSKVLMINDGYALPLTHDTKVLGNIDLVMQDGNTVNIRHIGARGTASWEPGTINWYKMILDSMAFRHKTGGVENKVTVECLRAGKTVDYVVTEANINEVKGLAAELSTCSNYLPTRKNYFCKSCSFHNECYPN